MKKQINRRLLQSVLPAAIALIFLLLSCASHSAFAQTGSLGAKYNSRDPRTCADATSPKTGAPSAAQAAQFVVCENEGISGDKLYFVEDVKVQVGAGRRYNPREDINFSGIDTKFLIYPIRGSYKSYQCTAIFPDRTNSNRNCSLYNALNATGACYKKDFGEWRCMLADIQQAMVEDKIPPPGAAKRNPTTTDQKPAQNNQPQNTEQQADNKTAGKGGQMKAGEPAPDFSEMEDWFEIVRYEYPKAPDRMMWIYFKPKVEGSKRPYIFYVEFRDKDGILVQAADASPVCCSSELMETANGETAKVRVQIPVESLMKQVTSVKVVRAK